MTKTSRPLLPLLAALLLFSRVNARADIAMPHDYRGLIGPLSEDQLKQQQAYDSLSKTNPSALPPVVKPAETKGDPDEGPGDQIYANNEAASVNNVDSALGEIGPGVGVPGQLPAGAVVKDYGGKRYYCDDGGCNVCPGQDCSSVIPADAKGTGAGQIAAGGVNGVNYFAGGRSSGGAGLSGLGGGSTAGGVGGTGTIARGMNAAPTGGILGGLGGSAGLSDASGNPVAAVHRGDDPKPKTVSALVQDVVLPAVDTLKAGVVEAGENGSLTTGGGAEFTGTADKKTPGGAPQVRYTGGSFDSLGAINNSKALGDASGMLGDTAGKSEGLKTGHTGKQTNNFSATKGDGQ